MLVINIIRTSEVGGKIRFVWHWTSDECASLKTQTAGWVEVDSAGVQTLKFRQYCGILCVQMRLVEGESKGRETILNGFQGMLHQIEVRLMTDEPRAAIDGILGLFR